jgi:hypothetical protein
VCIYACSNMYRAFPENFGSRGMRVLSEKFIDYLGRFLRMERETVCSCPERELKCCAIWLEIM